MGWRNPMWELRNKRHTEKILGNGARDVGSSCSMQEMCILPARTGLLQGHDRPQGPRPNIPKRDRVHCFRILEVHELENRQEEMKKPLKNAVDVEIDPPNKYLKN